MMHIKGLKGSREMLTRDEIKQFKVIVDSYVNMSNFAAQHNFSRMATHRIYHSRKPIIVSRDTAEFVRGVIG